MIAAGATQAQTGPGTTDQDRCAAGFVVRRAWSNETAKRGTDPCVPHATGRPFVALVPREPVVRLTRDGDSVVIGLDAAADRLVPSWSVSAIDLTGTQEARRYVEVTLDRTVVAPGESATLRITRLAAHRTHQTVVGVVSTVGGHRSLWPIAVSMR